MEIGHRRAEIFDDGSGLLDRCPSTELDRDTDEVSIHHRDSIRLGAHGERRWTEDPSGDRPEEFLRLGFQFFLLAGDQGQGVAEDVEGWDARVSGARDRLQGGDLDRFDAERVGQGFQTQGETDGGAVGVGDDATGTEVLMIEHLEVIGVDLRDQQRHLGVHPKSRRVGNDHQTTPSQQRLDFTGGGGPQRRKSDIAVIDLVDVTDHHI